MNSVIWHHIPILSMHIPGSIAGLMLQFFLFQLIYDFKDGGGSLGLISLLPDDIPEDVKSKFLRIGVDIPSTK